MSAIALLKPELKADLDFWYKPSTENFIRLTSALKDPGVEAELLDRIVFDSAKTHLKIPDEHFHTDFLPRLSGLNSYAECKQRTLSHTIDAVQFYVISIEDLLVNKDSLNRPADRDDARKLRDGPDHD